MNNKAIGKTEGGHVIADVKASSKYKEYISTK